jgi:PAS domain S-box-containing protein
MWVRSEGKTYRENIEFSEIIGVTTDISDIKSKENALTESRKKYYGLFHNMPVPAIIHKKGLIVDANKACLEFAGTDDEKQIIGRSAIDFVHPDSKELALERIKKILEFNEPAGFVQEKFITFSGEIRLVETMGVPFIQDGEQMIQVVFYDVTKHIISEQELKENQKKLAELNATKDKFFSLIAHDLKNPFHQIMGFTDILNENVENYDCAQIRSVLQYINSAASGAYRLLENLLQWSRSQTGRIEYKPENISVFDVVMTTIDFFQAACKNKEISISQTVEPDLQLIADREMLETILRNLLSNAIKFSQRKGKIIISASSDETSITLTVKDFGVGMSAEQIQKLYQIDQSHSTEGTENEPGTGLGLILTKEFVHKNGGTLRCESEKNKGTSFSIKFSKQR